MQWSHEEISEFIELYRKMPMLWDPNNPSYKDKELKRTALDSLAAMSNKTTIEVRRKMHNLRCQYNRQLRQIRKLAVTRGVDDSLLTSDWKYFKNFSFLRTICVGAEKQQDKKAKESADKTKKFQNISDSDVSFDSNNEEPEIEELDYNTNNDNILEAEITNTEIITLPESTQIIKAEPIYFVNACDKQISTDFNIVEQGSILAENQLTATSTANKGCKRSNSDNTTGPDEDHCIFGEFIASELRNLNSRSAKKLKNKILRAILEVTEEQIE